MSARPDPPRGVIGSLLAALGRIRTAPIIIAAGFAISLLSGTLMLPSFVHPLLANVSWIPWIVIWPFLIGGFFGMVVEAKTGRTSLSTLVSAGKSHYRSMLGATLLFAGIMIAMMFVSIIFVVFFFIFAIAGAATGLLDGGFSLFLAGLVLIIFLPYFLVYLFLQFYDVGIVAGGERAVSSLVHSIGLVKTNFLAVIGYSIVFFIIQLIGYGPGYAVLFFAGLDLTEAGQWVIVSGPHVAVGTLLMLTLGTLGMALAFTYHVTFYESIVPEPVAEGEPETASP